MARMLWCLAGLLMALQQQAHLYILSVQRVLAGVYIAPVLTCAQNHTRLAMGTTWHNLLHGCWTAHRPTPGVLPWPLEVTAGTYRARPGTVFKGARLDVPTRNAWARSHSLPSGTR